MSDQRIGDVGIRNREAAIVIAIRRVSISRTRKQFLQKWFRQTVSKSDVTLGFRAVCFLGLGGLTVIYLPLRVPQRS